MADQPKKDKDTVRTVELKSPPLGEQQVTRAGAGGPTGTAPTMPSFAERPGAAPAGAPAPADEKDQHIASKLQEIVQARTMQKGSEVSVVKLQDIIRIVREMLGGITSKDIAALQDEIVRLKLQNQQGAQLTSEVERLRTEVERLKGESSTLTAEVARLKAELEKAAKAAADAEAARALLEERNKKLEEILGMSGKTLEEMQRDAEELRRTMAELEERVRSQKSDVQYAQLVEEPSFDEMAASAAGLEQAAAKAPARVAEQARAAAGVAAASVKADRAAWKSLLDEVYNRRGTVRNVARLEVMSGLGNATRRELDRWQKAVSE